MNRKTLYGTLTAVAALCVAACLLGWTDGAALAILSFPYAQIAAGLRALSLSGAAGNAAALVLYAAVCFAPAGYLALKMKRGKRPYRGEDFLLVLTSLLLFIGLYLMINPGELAGMFPMPGMAEAGKLLWGGVIDSVLVGYVILRLMTDMERSEAEKGLLQNLRALIVLVCIVLVLGIFGGGLSGLLESMRSLRDANTGNAALGVTEAFLALRAMVNVLPYCFALLIALRADDLLAALAQDRYGEGAVQAAEKLAELCKTAVVTMTVSCLAFNIAQMMASGALYASHYAVNIPVISIALTLAVMLFARYLAGSKALKDENDSII